MISSSGPGIKSVEELIRRIQEKSVYVGVPDAKTNRESTELTNAELAFIHTNGVRSADMRNEMNDSGLPYSQAFQAYILERGSPLWNVPPRPIIQPAIEEETNKTLISEQMGNVINALAESNEKGDMEREKLGLLAQNIVRDWFDNPLNGWPPNARATIKAKGSNKPLVDTNQLRKSLTYVVRED